ncbi:major capsid protein P2 [Parvibaculum sp.]|uniref:major capsid protein P2 n=1 Tax=Parvibaculum sp. TaxID=2024848 RepID=UPI00391A7140
MFRRTVPVANINGVGAGQVATIDLPLDRRYHSLMLRYSESGTPANQATMDAAITRIRVIINSRTQREYSAAELRVLNAVNGAPYAFQAGFLPIYFSEPWRRTPGGEDALAWPVYQALGIQSFQVEVTIAAGRVSPALSAKAVIDQVDPSKVPFGPIVTTRRRVVDVGATGPKTLLDMPKNLGDYRALHAFEDTANDISGLRVTVDQLIAFDRTDAENTAFLNQGGYVPQTAVFHAIFDEDRRFGDGLPMIRGDKSMVSEFTLEFDMAAANPFTLIAEMLGGLS